MQQLNNLISHSRLFSEKGYAFSRIFAIFCHFLDNLKLAQNVGPRFDIDTKSFINFKVMLNHLQLFQRCFDNYQLSMETQHCSLLHVLYENILKFFKHVILNICIA